MKAENKIVDIRNDLNTLLVDWQDFRKDKKACTKGVHGCDFLQLFLDYANEVDSLVLPVEEYAVSCLDEDGLPNFSDEKDVLRTLVMMQKNALNMMCSKLKEILDSAQSDAEKINKEYSDAANRLEQINRNLNRISLFLELENDMA